MQVTEETEITKVQATETIRTTGRNNCGGRCVICVHMKDGKIEQDGTAKQVIADYTAYLDAGGK